MSNIFNEVHALADGGESIPALAFIKSLNVQAYPCGRRRSALINDEYHIPFDPEARLNTELNNRKHSGVNGFTDTYIKEWSADKLLLVLAGYSFEIKMDDVSTWSLINYEFGEGSVPDKFANLLAYTLQNFYDALEAADKIEAPKVNESSKFYANIRLEEIPLHTGEALSYNTWVLRNQSASNDALASLDLLTTGRSMDQTDASAYYFSGLSFTSAPLTGITTTRSERTIDPTSSDQRRQKIISLCILNETYTVSDSGEYNPKWVVNQEAYLPKVEHGKITDSIAIGDTFTNTITTRGARIVRNTTNEKGEVTREVVGNIPALRVVEIAKDRHQLQFFFGDTPPQADVLVPEGSALNKLGETPLGFFILGEIGADGKPLYQYPESEQEEQP